ncbi:MAG: Hsp20 family protein [Patescibacteria group bacterium]|jgi:HSP20 family protein
MVKIYVRTFSNKFKNLREEKKLTQEELAERLGISRQSVISVERGKNLPSLPLALRIAEIFEQSFDELFFNKQKIEKGGENKMPRYIMPWSPLRDLDRFFEDDDLTSLPGSRGWQFPAVDVKQSEKDVTITANIAGIKEEDINVEVGDTYIDISGERKAEIEEKEEDYYRKEIRYGSFARRIPLPAEVNADKAEASIKDGQLRIIAPKIEPEKPKTTKIKIKKES